MERILGIFGAGGMGREVLELAHIINERQKRWGEIIVIIDVEGPKEVNGTRVYSYEVAKGKYGDCLELVIAVGEPEGRKQIWNKLLADNMNMANIVHPDVHIPKSAVLGRGIVINQNAFVSCNVNIRDNVYLQPFSNVGHDTVIGESCVISSGCNLAGYCNIGEYTYMGICSSIKDRVNIGHDVIIGMGAMVFKDIPDEVIAMGNPARPIRRNEEHRVFK